VALVVDPAATIGAGAPEDLGMKHEQLHPLD
jgi:hypothetical protein